MSTTIKRSLCWNPYQVNGNDVKEIVIYDEKGEVLRLRQGWIMEEHRHRFEFEREEFRRANKINYKSGDFFYNVQKNLGVVLYLPAACLTGFELLGERVALANELESCFGIYYKLEGREFMAPVYTKVVPTPYKEKLLSIGAQLKEAGFMRHSPVGIYDLQILATLYPCILEASK